MKAKIYWITFAADCAKCGNELYAQGGSVNFVLAEGEREAKCINCGAVNNLPTTPPGRKLAINKDLSS